MKIERTKYATRGIAFGLILKIFQMIVPFGMRTFMLYYMGVQYLGLNSLFASVLQVLNLAELGVGSAMVFSMYKPIQEDDTDTICCLLRLYRTYYRAIGMIVALVGLALTPVIPKLIKGAIPEELSIYVLYLMNLLATVLTYWLFSYKNSLLQAHQRNDIISIIMLFTNILQYSIQFVVIYITRNYYCYVLVLLSIQIVNNITTAFVVNRMYPQYKAIGELPKEKRYEINRRVRDLFTSKIGGVIMESADAVVISAFMGLASLAIYQNYSFILVSVIGMVQIIFSSIMAGLGNSFIVDKKEKVYSDFTKFMFMYQWLIGICVCCFLCLFQPFMRIWVNDNEDLILGFGTVVCFCIYYYFIEWNRFLNVYKDAAGLWEKDRFRPLVAAIVNLTLNVIMVQFWGLYGVILSTVISIIAVELPWLIHNLFTIFFDKKNMWSFIKQFLSYCIVSGGVCVVVYSVCRFINLGLWGTLFVRMIVCVGLVNLLFLILFWRKKEFADSIRMVDRIFKGKFHLEKIFFRK